MEWSSRLGNDRLSYYRMVYNGSTVWHPSKDLTGKRVVVYCEQGMGDTIQFARWLPLLKGKGCEVILHCPEEIMGVMGRMSCVDAVVNKASTVLPPHDYHCLTFDLPFLLSDFNPKTEFPYICTDREASFEGGGKVVAVAWEGNPAHKRNLQRACPLKELRPLASIPGVNLVSLHKERLTPALSAGIDFDIAEGVVSTVEDAMAVIAAADAVVVVDTLAIHLAGAMGVPAVGLIDSPGDWRWSCPIRWYPSLRLVHQEREGCWATAVAEATRLVNEVLEESRREQA